MDDIEGVWTEAAFDFLVRKSPLIGQIPGGPNSRYGWGTNVTMDVRETVLDPDCDEQKENCSSGWHFE